MKRMIPYHFASAVGADPFSESPATAPRARWAAGRTDCRTVVGRTIRGLIGAAILLSLSGCIPVMIAAGAALGGDRPTASTLSDGNNKMTAGRDVQHSRPADRSVGDALKQSEGEVSDGCRSQLPDADQRDPTRTCQARWVCLPGAQAPMRLRVCESGRHPDLATGTTGAHIAAWSWNEERR